jgi:hypothetical protein
MAIAGPDPGAAALPDQRRFSGPGIGRRGVRKRRVSVSGAHEHHITYMIHI